MSGDNEAADEAMTTLLADTTAKLGSTVTSLPQLLEAKRLIDLHTNVATTLLDVIKDRKLDVLFELEQKLLQHSPLGKQSLVIQNQMKIADQPVTQFLSAISHQEDVLRVLIIAFLCQETVSQNGYDQMINLLRERGIEESALKHVQKLKFGGIYFLSERFMFPDRFLNWELVLRILLTRRSTRVRAQKL